MSETALVYMTSWCPDCSRSRRVLRRLGVPFYEIDIEEVDGAEEEMKRANGGSGKVPTILFDGQVLIEPTDQELESALRAAAV